MKVRLHLIAALSMVLTVSLADAKVLYVDQNTGNDATTYESNSATSPWRTIGRAAWGSTTRSSPNASQAARAGDTVIVRSGTYSTAGSGLRYDPAYNPANSGTAAQPIVFQAEGTVTLTLSSSRGPVIGSHQRNYITWKGFTINEANAPSTPDTGMVVLWASTGSGIEDCFLDGNGDPGYGDNHPGIRAEGSSYLRIRNNRLSNFRTSVVNPSNGAAIQFYTTGNVLIENNEISDSGSGIFLKATLAQTGRFDIRNNLIRNTWMGIAVHRSPNTESAPVRIHQNIIAGAEYGVVIWMFDVATGPHNVKIVNNTIYGARTGLYMNGEVIAGANHVFWNNIVSNSVDYAINWNASAATLSSDRLDAQHNLYYGYGRFAIVWDQNHTLQSWQSGFAQDSTAPASRSADPLFVNATQQDFRLQASSPARVLGIDLFDLNGNGSTTDTVPAGAYVRGNEVIGRITQAVPAPNAPANVTAE